MDVRSLLTLPFEGRRLFGTAHEPEGAGPGRLAFLLLNPGPAPRSGNSDLSTRLGDRLAALGAYVFRFDLPGLGDSEGDLPDRVIDFWREIQTGRNDRVALELGRRLRSAYRPRKLVVGGLCGGAITSLRAADMDPGAFDGLLLLEPSFKVEAEFQPKGEADPLRRALFFLMEDRRALRPLRPIRPLLSRVLGGALPPDVDADLVARWRRALARRVPTFLALAPTHGREHFCRRVLAEIPAYRRRALTEVCVPESNHLFTWGEGKDEVLRAAARWAEELMRREPS